jgi:cell division protein FtsB
MLKERFKYICSCLFRRENIRSIAIVVGLTIFAWFAIFGDMGLYQLHQSIKLKSDVKNQIEAMQKKIEALKENKILLENPKHLELVIRQELGYVKPDEVVFQKMKEKKSE